MKALYLDASAFIKLIVREQESDAVRRYLRKTGGRQVSSSLLRTESLRAVRRLGPDTLAAVRDGLRRIDLIGIDDRLLDTAGLLEPRVLRTLDALHLATALAVGDDLEAIVTYDDRMVEAARLIGLPTVSPR